MAEPTRTRRTYDHRLRKLIQVSSGVGDEGEAGRVALRKAVLAEAADLLEDSLGKLARDALCEIIADRKSRCPAFGPSPKAFLVVPLVGAFSVDRMNALVIKFFTGFMTF